MSEDQRSIRCAEARNAQPFLALLVTILCSAREVRRPSARTFYAWHVAKVRINCIFASWRLTSLLLKRVPFVSWDRRAHNCSKPTNDEVAQTHKLGGNGSL
jgi:hypothetical protein